MLGLIYRTFGCSSNVNTRKLLYISLVGSQLTYCSTIRRSHLIRDITLLETLQTHATKWILDDYVSYYKTRLETIHLLPLMMIYELNNLAFFLKSFQTPSQSFDNLNFVSFTSSSTRSNGTKLKHNSCMSGSNTISIAFLDCGTLFPLLTTTCLALKSYYSSGTLSINISRHTSTPPFHVVTTSNVLAVFVFNPLHHSY